MTLPMTASLSASELVSEATWFEQALDGAALALEDLDDLEGDPVDVGRATAPEQRPEAAEQRGQVQRRLGLGERDDAARLQRPAAGPFASVSAM